MGTSHERPEPPLSGRCDNDDALARAELADQRQPAPQPHTPAPWRVRREAAHEFTILADRGVVVCEIIGPFTPGFDREEADARLISAAPELLAVARYAYAHCNPTAGREDEWMRLLLNALARVEGQS